MAKKWKVRKNQSTSMMTVIENVADPDDFRFLETEHGRLKRYASELSEGVGLTKGGKVKELTPEMRAYRAGALDQAKRQAKIFKKKNPDYKRKTQ